MFILPKAIQRFNAVPTKIPMAFFMKIEKAILKFVWNHKRPQTGKAIFIKNDKAGDITLTNFKYITKHTIQNSVVLEKKQTHTSVEQNRQPPNKPMNIWLTNFLQLPRVCSGKRIISSINGFGKTG